MPGQKHVRIISAVFGAFVLSLLGACVQPRAREPQIVYEPKEGVSDWEMQQFFGFSTNRFNAECPAGYCVSFYLDAYRDGELVDTGRRDDGPEESIGSVANGGWIRTYYAIKDFQRSFKLVKAVDGAPARTVRPVVPPVGDRLCLYTTGLNWPLSADESRVFFIECYFPWGKISQEQQDAPLQHVREFPLAYVWSARLVRLPAPAAPTSGPAEASRQARLIPAGPDQQ